MTSFTTSALVFGCVFGGALVGVVLRRILPEHHLSSETKDVVRVSIALVGTMSALVLGVLVGAAKGTYDTQRAELTSLSADVGLLDRILEHYGPEARVAREHLRQGVVETLGHIAQGPGTRKAGSTATYDAVLELSPKSELQSGLKSEAERLVTSIGHTRSLMTAQMTSSISTTLLAVVVFWLSMNFVSFGLFAKPNATVGVALFIAALSVSGAILLILEMDRPYAGLIRLSDAPLREALAQMSQ